eukprot:TRINITY_DN50284_c0_g1_i1.p1 TRINITY_DN50284_c0_g1~~TRINITY_DN50284_c0_g1_i1.p1  ORF type:complete len:220 (-),score=60.32 TRINITY_DN50284_c0_g1_i1:221-835(-)
MATRRVKRSQHVFFAACYVAFMLVLLRARQRPTSSLFVQPAQPLQQHRSSVVSIQAGSDDAELSSYTVVQLKERLKERSLTVSGNKAQLIERLQAAILAESAEESEEDEDAEDAEDAAEDEYCEIDFDLESCTVSALKGHLRERGLPVSGKKADLIERLRSYEGKTQDAEEDEPTKAKAKRVTKVKASTAEKSDDDDVRALLLR